MAIPSGRALPGMFNVFVPSFDAGGKLTVMYSRNTEDFSLNKWVQLIKVDKPIGYYLRLSAEQAARIVNTNLASFVWPESNDAPDGNWNTEDHAFAQFNCIRYAFPFVMGYQTVENAEWDIIAQHSSIAAQQAMTGRTQKMLTLATTSSSYDTNHSDTATNWGGGFWDQGASTTPYIKKGLNKMMRQINLDTLGAVKPKDMVLVLDPVSASKMGASAEIHDYVKSSYEVRPALTEGSVDSQLENYGLPRTLYGYKVVIEDCVKITKNKGQTKDNQYILGGNTALFVARPGSLSGMANTPSFSTFAMLMEEEMTVETRDDPDNRRTKGRVVENYDVQAVAPSSGCLVTNLFS